MSRATLRALLGVTAATLLTGLGLSLTPGFATPANAAGFSASAQPASTSHQTGDSPHGSGHSHQQTNYDKKVHEVLTEAKRQKGKPYAYGAAGPHAFDCSGLVMYVFRQAVHRSLPHNAAEQYDALHHISRHQLRKGDLVFTDNGSITHVGIFAGHHHWWVAPNSGARVHRQRIYHAHFVYARVLRVHH